MLYFCVASSHYWLSSHQHTVATFLVQLEENNVPFNLLYFGMMFQVLWTMRQKLFLVFYFEKGDIDLLFLVECD